MLTDVAVLWVIWLFVSASLHFYILLGWESVFSKMLSYCSLNYSMLFVIRRCVCCDDKVRFRTVDI